MVNCFNKLSLRKIISVLLIFNFLSGCAAIPAYKIKLESYPKINKEDAESLSLNYSTFKFIPDKKGYEFTKKITKIINDNIVISQPSRCSVEISNMHSALLPRACVANYFLAGFTLFTIPFYCQHRYEIKANLISYPDESKISGVILSSINQAKAGDLFLDKNNQLAKLLNRYHLEDKVHEVWSSLWMLSWFIVNPTKYAKTAEHPKDARKITENNISEALVRQIIHDASQFEECQKE